MSIILIQEKTPKLKLKAQSNSTFQLFVPISFNKVVPANLADYLWQSHIQIDKLHPTVKLFSLTCTPSVTGILLQAAQSDLNTLFSGVYATLEERTLYGNLLYNQPGLTGIYCVAATIELVVAAGATEWT